MASPSRDARRHQDLPSCLVPRRRSALPISALGLTNYQRNKRRACHFCRAADEISDGDAAADLRHRVAARILRQQKNLLS